MKRAEFSAKTKAAVRERSGGICEAKNCTNQAAEIDHIEECWENEEGGDNSLENAKHLCLVCHKAKTKHSMGIKAWGNHFRVKELTIEQKRQAKASRKSGKIESRGFSKTHRKKMDGTVREIGK